MTSPDQMVIVNGVRYRPEDAPKQAEKSEPVQAKQAEKPDNKARSARNK